MSHILFLIGLLFPIKDVNLYVQYHYTVLSFSFYTFSDNKMNNDLRVRPKPIFGISDDAEDEMLNYQELFHRSNIQPSARVIREPKLERQQSNINEDKKRKHSTIDLTETTVMRSAIIVRKTFFQNL